MQWEVISTNVSGVNLWLLPWLKPVARTYVMKAMRGR
eukprot:CAMPEP_0117778446 /NCGR_PEP_ID=MMETSP0948-20121206/1002_1 /TAXON_ID=44440 /ORGANISM="Chattonella subsalsa, Strain CCMP2191" /LENGTH=36 /DNA_ID= /DNA_START= /DNA_END= /DNA_ORIENTATION=